MTRILENQCIIARWAPGLADRLLNDHDWVAVKELKLSYYIGGNPIIYYIYIYPLW